MFTLNCECFFLFFIFTQTKIDTVVVLDSVKCSNKPRAHFIIYVKVFVHINKSHSQSFFAQIHANLNLSLNAARFGNPFLMLHWVQFIYIHFYRKNAFAYNFGKWKQYIICYVHNNLFLQVWTNFSDLLKFTTVKFIEILFRLYVNSPFLLLVQNF